MRDISFIDKTFDITQTNLYHLSIQISLDGFYFSVLDIPRGKYVLLNGHHLFLKRNKLLLRSVRQIMEEDEMFGKSFKSVEILFGSRRFTLVPQAFYGRASIEKYLWFNVGPEKGSIVVRNPLTMAECSLLYDIPQNLHDYLVGKYPKVTIKHNLVPLIEKSLRKNKPNGERSQMHLNFFRDHFEMVIINGSKLILANSFSYRTDRDILYFVLYTYDQLKLAADSCELIIHGHLPQVAPVYHMFKKYIKYTSFARLDTMYQYSYTFSQVPEHYYSSLLSVYKCE